MKKIYLYLFTLSFLFFACKKGGTTTDPTIDPVTPPSTYTFSDLKVNSLKFVGTAAKLKGSITVTNPDVNAISGISNTSFVNGTLTRAVNTTGTYNFPVSTGSGASEKSTSLKFTPNNLVGTTQLAAKYT
ncbi:MAG: hypothetical protein EOO93_24200, partial [Pedobacter sp.]